MYCETPKIASDLYTMCISLGFVVHAVYRRFDDSYTSCIGSIHDVNWRIFKRPLKRFLSCADSGLSVLAD